ncbi:MAG: hypothetical protein HFI77_10915 [Lachnospiraceae bacterium]|jgi:Uncharacterized protein conserved in bacteria|nr:hypothetical protein [Lachnospiraceae bacterium]RKJ62286.1 hypothetical protein D7Y06_17830 [Roseburia sp. 1XD42-69]
MKEMIYTLIFAGLGILLILLLIFMFLPKESKKTAETMNYVAGVYTSTIQFNDNTIDVQVVVDESRIQSVSLVNLDETVTTMYPLMEPAVQEIASQVCEKQSTDNIAYSEDNPYTSMVILNAVKSALKKAETAP